MPVSRPTTRKKKGQIFVPVANFTTPKIRIVITPITDGVEQTNDAFEILDTYNEPINKAYALLIRLKRKVLNLGIGNFDIIIDNNKGRWNEHQFEGSRIDVYADYVDATIQIYRGRIDDALPGLTNKKGWVMFLSGRDIPELYDKKKIIETFDGISVFDSNKQIINNNFSNLITYNNMASASTLIYKSFRSKAGSTAIGENLERAAQFGYVDFDRDLNSFDKGTNKNDSAYISFGVNLESVPMGIGLKRSEERNRVYAYGSNPEGAANLFYLWMEEDTSKQDAFWIKDHITASQTIQNRAEAEDEAVFQLNDLGTAEAEGILVAAGGLLTLQPGQSIPCSVPFCKISGHYDVVEFTHFISPTEIRTSCNIKKTATSFDQFFRNRDDRLDEAIKQRSDNSNGMDSTFILTFNESPTLMSHSGTQESDSALELASGFSDGIASKTVSWVSDFDVAFVEVRIDKELTGTINLEVSIDDKESWFAVEENTLTEVVFSGTTERKVNIRFNLGTDADGNKPKIKTAQVGIRK